MFTYYYYYLKVSIITCSTDTAYTFLNVISFSVNSIGSDLYSLMALLTSETPDDEALIFLENKFALDRTKEQGKNLDL